MFTNLYDIITMKNYNLKMISLLIIPLLIINSCKEEKKETICTDVNTLKIPQEIKDRFFFKDSSYWIYKDSISGQIDSSWVAYSNIGISNNEKRAPSSKGKCFEGAFYEVKSTIQKNYGFFLNPSFSDKNTKFEDEYFYLLIDFIVNQTKISFSRIRYKGNILDSINFENGIIKKLNEIKIKDKTYSDIVYLFYPINSIDVYKKAYYANKIGIIKFEDNEGRVWELIRYKIHQ